ncbi:MAG: DUF1232 domain-containing protein [Roseburia sp.]|nr:DUF1232 domain-containing protein [Roseburia sp.]MCM1097481.1 DUF1232 domain-containing protein [Ruminococcus flavefaciens]
MKTNYEDILRGKSDEEIWILCNRMVEEEVVQTTMDEAGLNDFTRNCCKLVDKIARIPVLGKIAVEINLFCGMLADSCKKEYHISMATKSAILIALTYLVLPVDMIPDAIPFVGMLDDIRVLGIAAAGLENELTQYKNYLYEKNIAEYQKAMNVVASERNFQMEDEEADNKLVYMKREVA